ncbi:MAG TPA: hypothetical protein VNO70_11440 [Blastocatellia bacterium]|nr:hypothetical protein [Blastocatellia bacterium]
MKHFSLIVMALLVVGFGGCKRKPAYSDIQTGQTQSNVNQNSNSQPVTPPDPATASPAQAAQPAGAPPQQPAAQPFKMPAFVDQQTGNIKDLPAYPDAQRTNVSMGPMQGVDAALLVFRSGGPVEKVAAFYEKAVKNNGWTVVDSYKDEEQARWELKKGDKDEALIRIQKDANTGAVDIMLSRLEKPAQPKQ